MQAGSLPSKSLPITCRKNPDVLTWDTMQLALDSVSSCTVHWCSVPRGMQTSPVSLSGHAALSPRSFAEAGTGPSTHCFLQTIPAHLHGQLECRLLCEAFTGSPGVQLLHLLSYSYFLSRHILYSVKCLYDLCSIKQ